MNPAIPVRFFRDGQTLSAAFADDVPGLECYNLPAAADAGKIVIEFALPVAGVTGYWYGSLQPGVKMQLDWNISFVTGAQYNSPVFALVGRDCRCRAAVTLSDLMDDARFEAQLDQEHEVYFLRITVAAAPGTPLELRIDRRGLELDAMLADWRRTLPPVECRFPDAAWEPVYCTWYAKHGAVDAAWLEPTAARAADMGFKTLIVDDGWCYDEYCRVNPDTIQNWYRTIGDYRVSEVKFPRFAEHVRRVQKLGMRYLVWVAPHLIGFDSDFYRDHPDAVLDPCVEGYRRLKIGDAAACQLIADRLTKLMRDNGLDGLKIDFLDIVTPDPDAPNGRATYDFVRKLTDSLRALRPDALIEFRQNYANWAMLPLATQFRAGDAPFDALRNFGRLAEIRLALGDGVPVHADPAFWSRSDDMEGVARHMIAMLAGVPMLSMDLLSLTAMEERVIRRWLAFYHDHRQVLNFGAWHVHLDGQNIAAMTAEDDREKVILLNEGGHLPALSAVSGKPVYLANLSERAVALPGAELSGPDGAPVAGQMLPVGGLGIVR